MYIYILVVCTVRENRFTCYKVYNTSGNAQQVFFLNLVVCTVHENMFTCYKVYATSGSAR